MSEKKDIHKNEQHFRVELTLLNGWKINEEMLIYYLSQLNGLIKSVDKCEEIKNGKTNI